VAQRWASKTSGAYRCYYRIHLTAEGQDMTAVLRNPGTRIVLGFALGLVFSGSVGVSRASAEPKDCKASCACQSACETKLVACNSACEHVAEEKKTKCLIDCNQKLLKCMEKCPNPDCGCGGYGGSH
jgi:hypothetical protein